MTTTEQLRGVIPDMAEAEYHSHPAFSSTQARLILDSPARYQHSLTQPEEHKDTYDVGSAVHAKILGVGARVRVLDFDDYRTKAAREAKQDAYAAGEIPMLSKAMGPINGMAESVLAHKAARAVLEQDGTVEASVFAHDDGHGVDLRARFDFLPAATNRRRIAADVKTTAGSAGPRGFERAVADLGYDVQQGHYLDTARLAYGEEDMSMVWIVVEKTAPYLVAVHQLTDEYSEMGLVKAAHARETLARCRRTNTWPGYGDVVTPIRPPFWAVSDFQDRFGASDLIEG